MSAVSLEAGRVEGPGPLSAHALNENQMFVQGFPLSECAVCFEWTGMSVCCQPILKLHTGQKDFL